MSFPDVMTLAFELMFTRPRTGIGLEKQGQILNRVADLLDQGVLKTNLKRGPPSAGGGMAHRLLKSGHTVGKIVLTM